MKQSRDITKEEARQWLKENESKGYLGHGMADRHAALIRMMKEIVER